jgi:hypothetical protein
LISCQLVESGDFWDSVVPKPIKGYLHFCASLRGIDHGQSPFVAVQKVYLEKSDIQANVYV